MHAFLACCHIFLLANRQIAFMISRCFAPAGQSPEEVGRSAGRTQFGTRRAAAMVSSDFRLALAGYGLTTAEIHYRLPDHPSLLQQFVWQQYDLAPDFPTLRKFLNFWEREIEGALHSVRIAHNKLIKPSEWRAVDGVFHLH